MYAAAAPSPAPASPWQPAHHFTYTRLPAVVSCAARERGAGSGTVPAATTSVTRSRSARSVMTAPCLTAPCSLSFLPRPRLPPRLLVQEQNHRPDLPLGEEVLPHRHRRVPGRALAGEAGPALRDAPEHEALGELRDRAVVLEAMPAFFVVADVDQHAHEHRDHVLQHDAFRDDGTPRQDRHHPHDHDVGEDQDPHRLPERMLGVPPDGGREGGAHLCAARYCTSASSCAAFIMVPKLLGMIPASFS